MSKKLYEEANISDIANAIREKNGTQNQYTVAQMPSAIRAIHTQPNLETLNATSNGHYLPSSGKDGFNEVNVQVPSGSNLETLNATSNGHYSPSAGKDGFSEVNVQVPASINAPHLTTQQLSIPHTNGVMFDSFPVFNAGAVSIDGTEHSAGYEGFNIVLSDLDIGKTYLLSFDFVTTNGNFLSGPAFGWDLYDNLITNYQNISPTRSLTRQTNVVDHFNIGFYASNNIKYFVFCMAGYSDNGVNAFSINNLKVTESQRSFDGIRSAFLSSNATDKVQRHDRWFQRSTNEPIIFIPSILANGQYTGYACINFENSLPSGTHPEYGNLQNLTEKVTQSGTTYYVSWMYGQYPPSTASNMLIFDLDEASYYINISDADVYADGNGTLSGDSQALALLESHIDRIYDTYYRQ